ncbi:5-aminopentanamidase [Williamsia sterculiae]|uniref:5-aminopentanamidase n=2 Tax=Williamsia sterculiae TaxID=1344003 RepID=A0A1N7FKM9_9NOCA|nr:5-aminopentanamidase [Williamsia sterculiae]
MDAMQQLRIALWQCQPRTDDVPRAIADLADRASVAAAEGARLLICPEMYLSGYHIDSATARRLAQPADGEWARQIGAVARDTNIALLYGFPELAGDGTVYNAVRLVGNNGVTVAVHRKTHLFGEIDRAAVTASDRRPTVFHFEGWRLALLICYEVEFPEVVRRLAVAGADLVCVPTANMPDYDAVQRVLIPARAFENQVYVAYANFCGTERGLDYGGLSLIAGPSGATVVEAGTAEGMIVGDLDKAALRRSRHMNPYLAERRPELYD